MLDTKVEQAENQARNMGEEALISIMGLDAALALRVAFNPCRYCKQHKRNGCKIANMIEPGCTPSADYRF